MLHQLGNFLRAVVAGHFGWLKKRFHLRTPVSENKGSRCRNVKNALIYGALHLFAGAVEIDFGVLVKERQLAIIAYRVQVPEFLALRPEFA